MRWLNMSHLIKIYAVFKFGYFRLWYLKELSTGDVNSCSLQTAYTLMRLLIIKQEALS